MSKLDFTVIEHFDVFQGKKPGSDPLPQSRQIDEVIYNGTDELDDYIPGKGNDFKIVQSMIEEKGKKFIMQHLSGDGWRQEMIDIAKLLRMEHVKPPNNSNDKRMRVIDRNVTDVDNHFGVDGKWKIQSWEVIADQTDDNPDNHRFIDTIKWVKRKLNGKGELIETSQTETSIHAWRIYP